MSRLIVKNLPNGMKEERFRKLFAAFGTLTDCCLKYTKDGRFRKFGFIGYKSEDEAQTALNHFNKSFIDTSRITVELCKSFGDPTKPKAWSKHSQKAPASENQTKEPLASAAPAGTKRDKKKKDPVDNLKELKEDKTFQEFLVVHQKRSQVATWANDTLAEEPKKGKPAAADYLNFDSDESEELSEGGDEPSEDEEESEGKKEGKKAATSKDLSDMDYLKSKVVKDSSSSSSTEEETETEEEESETEEDSGIAETHPEKRGKPKAQQTEQKPPAGKKKKGSTLESQASSGEASTPFTVKLCGAPSNTTEQKIREFFFPLKPVAIRMGKKAQGKNSGYIFVDLKSEAEMQRALKRKKEFLGGRCVEVSRCRNTPKETAPAKPEHQSWQRTLRDDEEEEDLSESGRLFVRNLPFTSTEEDLEKIFSKYGPVSEIHFPIDKLTKKPKGFAFITYMIPEHAVKALAELDGQVFQGRMMHLLPSTIRKEKMEDGDAEESSSYKKSKEAKDKANSASSHNWNALFVGTNAVADAMAQKYNAAKSQVLDAESKDSVAVRVALGETELVQEIRRFLVENGVSLDSFSQAAGERSKTVILVKNLPAGTSALELEELFGKHGGLGRVLLPEGGITAIVEFLEPTEAKQAFTRLAYSKFHSVPLYLEWAPMGVFLSPAPQKKKAGVPGKEDEAGLVPGEAIKDSEEAAAQEEEEEEEEEEENIPGCTLFIKNLNFATTEDTLKETFSKVGALKSCTISKKKDKAGTLLSMGFGFVEYKKPESAQKALRQLQGCTVDGHKLEVKLSERAVRPAVKSARKKQTAKKQKTSKILVRNIPFQATVREIRELFSTFGELKTVRLPKKMAGTGSHRGFGFVDFVTKQDAKKAFNALCHSTHLYGRRLVLEWADTEETLEALRRKTAQHFHDSPKKRKRSEILNEIMEHLEEEDNNKDEDI
ncbi:probable RNA-binding protein 19 isoform X1 [Vidua chalybeata]|uniref:probable RNA-binding protein 19 isoform X1 n=1 Tax=Vidua chalybeata TaxID=81927 RepID=UPI0023A8FCE2|nr:probable RNA-binding protein 19 isoform X1 [Vidua chalybeata]XP_053815717.1 probable RNA-binding protein 19 isoform X1 [Vidua chalybeata]